MDNSEKDFVTVIIDSNQFIQPYAELFETVPIDSFPIYIEKNFSKDDFLQEERLFVLPSGIISVSTKNLSSLWDISEDDRDLFAKLNRHTEEVKKRYVEDRSSDLFSIMKFREQEYGIRYFPYGDVEASQVLMDLIEKKVRSLKGIPS